MVADDLVTEAARVSAAIIFLVIKDVWLQQDKDKYTSYYMKAVNRQ